MKARPELSCHMTRQFPLLLFFFVPSRCVHWYLRDQPPGEKTSILGDSLVSSKLDPPFPGIITLFHSSSYRPGVGINRYTPASQFRPRGQSPHTIQEYISRLGIFAVSACTVSSRATPASFLLSSVRCDLTRYHECTVYQIQIYPQSVATILQTRVPDFPLTRDPELSVSALEHIH